jgi:YVTN family beta-propeller protein
MDAPAPWSLLRISKIRLVLVLFTAVAVTSVGKGPAQAQGIVQAPALPGAQPISSRDRVYTSDQVSNTVTVINPATNEVLGTIALGNARLNGLFSPIYFQEINVHGLGFSPDGSLLDVINVTTNSAVVVNTGDNSVRDTFYLGRALHEGFISPNGRELWVAVRGQNYISVVDLAERRETHRIQTALSPSMVVFSPNGRLAFVDHARAAELDVIDVGRYEVVQRITNLVSPFSPNLAVSPDGREVWLTHKDVGKVTVVDARRFRVLAVLDTGPVTNHVNFVSKPTADYAYVTVGGTNETLVYRRNGGNPRLETRIANSGSTPHGLWPSPDNSRVYVVLENSDALDVIDTDSRQVIATLGIGQQPHTVVYVANAVPQGDGRANLGQQGLNLRILNQPAEVQGADGRANATIRALGALDMIDVAASGFQPNSRLTVFIANSSMTVPIARLAIDGQGQGNALAFTTFFDVFDRVIIVPQGQQP